jgi:hypothetical protein
MIKIQLVLPNTVAKFGLTGSPINAAAVHTNWTEEYAESILVTRGAVCYICEDETCVVVTPAGATKLTNLWPIIEDSEIEAPPAAAEPVPSISPVVVDPVVEEITTPEAT